MRRAIAAGVLGGLVLGGVVATPSFAAARGAGKAPGKERSAAPAKPRADSKATTAEKAVAKAAEKAVAKAAMKTVVYEGYEFQVPASWPVRRLDEHPQTCVRYDVHAVYLGTPGKDMRCAAGLVGRTQTVSIIPGQGATAGSKARGPGRPAAPKGAGGPELQRSSVIHGTVTQNAVQHELRVTLGTARDRATVLGTYGTSPAVVEQVINTLRLAPAGAAPTPQSAPAPPETASPETASPKPAPPKPAPRPASTSWQGVPAHWPVEIIQPPQPPEPPGPPAPAPAPAPPVAGFDTCTAPSLATMSVWHSDYAAVGAYIGGANSACASGNLSAGWMQSVASTGWGVLPIYVGPQAPCWSGTGVLVDPANPAAQGNAAGLDAISDAQTFGLAVGSPIYYDMEGYKGDKSCTNAVIAFLSAWDQQVTAAGYVSAVYSSQDSGIGDMQAAAAGKTPGFTPPDAIWIALWDGVSSLSDGTLAWPLTARSKQYAGNVAATVGGITLSIDKDLVSGPVAGLPRGSAGPVPARCRPGAGHEQANRFASTAVDS